MRVNNKKKIDPTPIREDDITINEPLCSICQAQEITSKLKPRIEIINRSTSYHFLCEVVTIVPSSVQCTKEVVFFLYKKKLNIREYSFWNVHNMKMLKMRVKFMSLLK